MGQLPVKPIWMERQKKTEQNLRELECQTSSFQNPQVIVNPYEIAPLTALVLFQTEVETAVRVTVSGRCGDAALKYTCKSEKQHRVPVYGLYAGQNNMVQLQLDDGQSCMLQIVTDPLPSDLASCTVTGSLPAGEWVFTVPVSGSSLPAAYDGTGACRWYLTEELAFQISLSGNGRILTCGPALLGPPYSAAAILELDLLGRLYREYRVPGGVCNGFFEMENGDLLALHQHFNRGTAADMCVQINRVTGAVIKEWDFRKLLPMTKGGSTSQNGSDWLHASSVWYEKETDSITITGTNQDILVNISYTSGQLNWMLGDPTGWPEDLVQQYFLQPVQADMEWSYEPGSVQVLPNHQILCFDNGHLRTKRGGTPLPAEQRYSRVVCYTVDAVQKTVEEVWSYGKDAGNQLYSPYLSSCFMDTAERCLMNFGGIGWLQGNVAEPPAFFLQKDDPDVEMQTIILLQQDGQTICRMQLPMNTYNARCIAVADFAAHDWQADGKVLGRWHGNDVYELELEWEDGGLIDDSYQITATLTSEQLILSGNFQQGEMVLLLLEGDSTVQLYMQTTRAPYLTAGVQTWAKGSDRPITYAVSLEGLSGQYEICIGIDDKKYHTGMQISV